MDRTGAMILTIIGLPFLVLGGCFAFVAGPHSAQTADRIASFNPMSAAQLGDLRPGREVLIEGRMSGRNEIYTRNYVAYVVSRCTTDSDGDTDCDVVARVTPPLRINLSQGYVNVANDSYSLADMSTVYDGDLQYDGIEPEAAVVAVGTLLPADGALQIEAEFIALGSQTSYVESLRREALTWRIIGTIFGLIGVGLLAAAVVVAIKA
jgi:hypothetical protein